MQKAAPILSVFFHNYYGNDQEWLSFFAREIQIPFNLFYNGVADSYYRVIQKDSIYPQYESTATGSLQQLLLRESTNQGKDIGGKLVLMDAWLKGGAQGDYILFLHDKHSPYHSHSSNWKSDLFRIAENKYRQKIIEQFKDAQTGMVASENAIRNEADNEQKSNAYTDSNLIQQLRNKYSISPPGLQYVAGTMFWVRASLFKEFFTSYAPLLIRSELEPGNITDVDAPTITHAWERLLCWIITTKGYKIKGV